MFHMEDLDCASCCEMFLKWDMGYFVTWCVCETAHVCVPSENTIQVLTSLAPYHPLDLPLTTDK